MGRTEWNRVAPTLQSIGLFTEADFRALEMYCDSYSRWRKARLMLAKEGMSVGTRNGYRQKSPHITTIKESFTQMLQMMTEFGMTPSARAGMDVPTPPDAANPFARFARH